MSFASESCLAVICFVGPLTIIEPQLPRHFWLLHRATEPSSFSSRVKGTTIGKYYCTIGMIVLNYSAIFVPAVEEEKSFTTRGHHSDPPARP
jgi:hypothetical protein